MIEQTDSLHYKPKSIEYCPIEVVDWNELYGYIECPVLYRLLTALFPVSIGAGIPFLFEPSSSKNFSGLLMIIIGVCGLAFCYSKFKSDCEKIKTKADYIEQKSSSIIADNYHENE